MNNQLKLIDIKPYVNYNKIQPKTPHADELSPVIRETGLRGVLLARQALREAAARLTTSAHGFSNASQPKTASQRRFD
ncbi:MAG: hypothetical protein OXI96_09865 [Acidimicrobiaceae bacterium]|nr:hypothetical protein [Acidimicrobiaceae bacterium]